MDKDNTLSQHEGGLRPKQGASQRTFTTNMQDVHTGGYALNESTKDVGAAQHEWFLKVDIISFVIMPNLVRYKSACALVFVYIWTLHTCAYFRLFACLSLCLCMQLPLAAAPPPPLP